MTTPHQATSGTLLLRTGLGLAAAAAVLGAATRAAAAPQPAEGQKTFAQICSACHTIGQGVRVGPDLKGVTERRDVAWIKRFVSDPASVRGSGDPIAKANVEKYKTQMPNLGLRADQVDDVVAYLGGGSAAPAGAPAPLVPTLGIAVLVVLGLTATGLVWGSKKVQVSE